MAGWGLLCAVPYTQYDVTDLGYLVATGTLASATGYSCWPVGSRTRLPILGKTCTGILTPQMAGKRKIRQAGKNPACSIAVKRLCRAQFYCILAKRGYHEHETRFPAHGSNRN